MTGPRIGYICRPFRLEKAKVIQTWRKTNKIICLSGNTHITRHKVWNLIHYYFNCTAPILIKTTLCALQNSRAGHPSKQKREDNLKVKWREPYAEACYFRGASY